MRAAKERKRLAAAAAGETIEVGLVRFSGPCFGGDHELRLLHKEGMQVLLVCDGKFMRPRSVRGVRAMLARRIGAEMGRRQTCLG
jgi:hypothetical protein